MASLPVLLPTLGLALAGSALTSLSLPSGVGGPDGPGAGSPSRPAAVVTAPGPAAAVPLQPGVPPIVTPAPERSGWRWPLEPVPRVLRPFAPGPQPWSPGHRGVDLAAGVGQAVLAPADGLVSFTGVVAGRGVVVLEHALGIRSTYEPVTAAVERGARVAAGDVIGHVAPQTGHCGTTECLHWGALRGARYLDPLGLIADAGPVVLLPDP